MFITRKHTKRILSGTIPFVLGTLVLCCDDSGPKPIEEPEDREPTPVEIKIPSNFPDPVYDLSLNPPTEEGVALGKRLFYDTKLSRTNTISCGFCHMQPFAFTHHGHELSHGVDDKLGRRNSLPVQNMIFARTFFWDGGVHNLDLVPLNAIANEVEMDNEVDDIITRLEQDDTYKYQFEEAFGSDEITSTRFLQALSQFLATMVSSNSKYDMHVRNENGVVLADYQLQGLALFKQKCATCHATDLFTDQTYRNNGYSAVQDFQRDKGREEITLNPEDRGKFKVPSLRNVQYTGPYMHNGKLTRLEEVLDFYSSGVHDTPTLDPLLKQNGKLGIEMTSNEKRLIIEFLYTLTDQQYLTDKKFSEY